MHVVDGDSIWHTMEVLCAYGMRSRIWKESKFGMIGYVKLSSTLRVLRFVFTGFRRFNRRQSGGQTSGVRAVRPAAATGAAGDIGGQTG